MRTTLKKIVKYLVAWPSIELARLWPVHVCISMMIRLNEIQLSAEQLKAIVITVKEKVPCKLLIFGLGNDSIFWLKLNRGGVTIFLEGGLEETESKFQKIFKAIASLDIPK